MPIEDVLRDLLLEYKQSERKEPRLFTLKEAAAKLRVSRSWLYKNKGDLPFILRLGPRQFRVCERRLNEYLARDGL